MTVFFERFILYSLTFYLINLFLFYLHKIVFNINYHFSNFEYVLYKLKTQVSQKLVKFISKVAQRKR